MTTAPVMGITEEILGEIERASWQLVPVEPTPEMLAATSWPGCAGADYAKMLAAAPAAPVAQGYDALCGIEWKPQGEANEYILLRGSRWVATVRFNGELLPEAQGEILKAMLCDKTVRYGGGFHMGYWKGRADLASEQQPDTVAVPRAVLGGIREALAGMLAIVDESWGVHGYHVNGDIAEWDEFPEVGAARAALAQQPAPAVPEGWKLVPRCVKKEMLDAARVIDDLAFAGGNLHGADSVDIWHAMFDAAPSADQMDTVKVPRELLERAVFNNYPGHPDRVSARDELRALLAGGAE